MSSLRAEGQLYFILYFTSSLNYWDALSFFFSEETSLWNSEYMLNRVGILKGGEGGCTGEGLWINIIFGMG